MILTPNAVSSWDPTIEAGDLVQADSGCIENETLVCGSFNARDEFVPDDCATNVGAPTSE